MNQVLGDLKLEKHPDKTQMGRVEKGFDFLGYHLSTKALGVATITLEKVQRNIAQLYEQGASIERIGQYWQKWLVWGCGD